MKLSYLLAFAIAATTAFAADTVKLRALDLKTVVIHVTGQDGKNTSIDVKYADLLKQVVTAPNPQGLSSDDVIKLVTQWVPLKEQIEANPKRILLTQAQYDLVTEKLNTFKWSPVNGEASEKIAEFIQYIRGLKETEFDAKEAPKT